MRIPIPINCPKRKRAHPLTILGVFTASGFIAFAVMAIIYQLIFQP